MEPDPELIAWLRPGTDAPLVCGEGIRTAIRALLREGGFKPSGRSKPASEYLLRACGEGVLGSINLAVDVCNVVSLHSGLPISVVDLDLARPPFRLAVAESKASYVFNPSGQELDLSGLLCLFDAQGPCGSPVKDSQRTKTNPDTRRTLSVVWGSIETARQNGLATSWYQELLSVRGAKITEHAG
ncbi:hypothetical protein DYH09_19100 [bacterium CPR1]|nr:hypothetical protein [bacterium CPR1]